MLQTLRELGADLDAVDKQNGETALMLATRKDNVEMVQLLNGWKADKQTDSFVK